ncbi:MAG: alanine racemase [Burkholderiales bacterium]|nr:alanine racemase [Burkholderiales bacterium]
MATTVAATDADLADPLLGPWLKGFPPAAQPLRRSQLARQGWRVADGALPLPLAVLKESALAHNLRWMQRFARERGLDLSPHGKTTMSPQLFARQLDAGAWGISFASVFQLRLGVAAGVRRALIANQVHTAPDLAGLARLLAQTPGLRVAFLVDSIAQLRLIEARRAGERQAPVFEVLLEVGVAGGRTGVREADGAIALARALRASPAVRLVGVECYEGLSLDGDDEALRARTDELMQRVTALAAACDREGLFESEEIIVSAGGSALFDLVAPHMRPALSRPVRGILRSGCYLTHDHGHYRRLVHRVAQRCGCSDELQPALEVWTAVQSTPEPGLALLSGGRRDLSFDIELPHVLALARAGRVQAVHQATGDAGNAAAAGAKRDVDTAWRITALNDQHAYLRWDAARVAGPAVGDLVALGISHPCTTFDKWHWMPIVDDDTRVIDAVTIHF